MRAPFKRRPHERRAKLPSRSDAARRSPKRPLLLQPRLLALIGLLVVVNWALAPRLNPPEPSVKVPYSPVFLDQVRAGNVERINSRGAGVTGEFLKAVSWPQSGDDRRTAKKFETQLPAFTDERTLERLLIAEGVQIDAEPIRVGRSLAATLLLGFGPVFLFVLLLVYIVRRAGGASGIGSFGRSRARRFEPAGADITFADVAGIEEAKQELYQVVDFLKNPERYQALGGRIPRGVLLTGQPGTGKTLLARAVAGEAGVPFFSSTASEFVEAVVGVGAARVRDTFKNAKRAAPATRRASTSRRSSSSTSSTRPAGSVPAALASERAATSASRRSTRSSQRWTASTRTPPSSSSRRRTVPRRSTPRSCGPDASIGA